ncbi:SDR family oxidoreductase [Deinococcus sp. QL22]|uniref:SDR family oxidoreductase n=1 Tax=Deinococcus sp. QL22 TaxID=2939437 RepID=UPI002016F255|nr:SDR family oxidoreductase [Deinococcus sp. QL22]UQN08698.1 SDR family oxidoreductase [Deinococcus sp. QL22]
MMLITGATGQMGTLIIQSLLKKIPVDQVAGLARDEDKAAPLKVQGIDIRIGDYDDSAALERAMQGVEKVLLIAGTDEHKRVQQHQNVVDAAKKAGVRCIAYTSRDLKNRDTLVNQLMLGHFQTEDLIKESGLNYIIFRNILYMDFIAGVVGENVVETGIHLPAGEGRVAYALRSELAEAMARALVDSDWNNRTYHFTGSQSYSFADVASALTQLSGQEVRYTATEKSVFGAQLTGRGVPAFLAERIAGFLTDIKNGQEDHVSTDLAHFLGRTPASLTEGLKVLFKL